ncbi:DUF6527 family protein [Ewingella americana]|uniref:Ammonia monooxygenase n=1 Tax=Ewingella americana TaxID=41202 RepID=A0A502GG39_9GAMM|nr:DUF6527 family protein [Ewingella americana]TPG59966.1 ammonia monooxygenase [Ewingella americana]
MSEEVIHKINDDTVVFHCPGCGRNHQVQIGTGTGPRWGWNHNNVNPTFSPSILASWSEPSDNEEEFMDSSKDKQLICHSFVNDGSIQFLNDCTHDKAGQTAQIPKWIV